MTAGVGCRKGMPGVDQILSAIVQQGADELRLASDETPLVLARGAPRRFSMSPTPDSVLRGLLGDLLTPERLAEAGASESVVFEHVTAGSGRFTVTLARRASGGLELTFVRATGPGGAGGPAPAAPAPERPRASAPAPAQRPEHPPGVPSRATEPLRVTPHLTALCERAVAARASDVHLADGEPPHFRIDGRLEPVPGVAGGLTPYLELDAGARDAVFAGRSADFGIDLDARQRLRLNVYRVQGGLAAAIRLLPRSVPALGELGLPLALDDLAALPHGLVLVCGATGSGKSTTLAALCQRALEKRSVLLVTLEDPIEYLLVPSGRSLVRQRQIGREVPDFNAGLRDALRSDLDVIMVGELRDAQTIRLALTAAETGHLVLASLHSGSAAGALERVVDAYPNEQRAQIRTQLADALRAIVVQRLLPRARGSGRVPALEVLRVTHGVGNVIREGKTAQLGTMLQAGRREGMLSLERCLAELVQAGAISTESARGAANDLDSLAMYLAK